MVSASDNACLYPRSSFMIEDQVSITFNIGNIHIFDKETELAIR